MKTRSATTAILNAAMSVLLAAAGGTVASLGQAARADDTACIGKVPSIHVLGEALPSTTYMTAVLGDFEKHWQTKVGFDVLSENDRRSKSRLDASQGAGAYQVYLVDEANVADFASHGWIVPLDALMPKDWDWNDFLAGRRAVATVDGHPYFAPVWGGGDLMMYRKDIFAAKGLQPPATLDDYIKDVALLNDPEKDLYGTALRGRRGSGANVWRWTPFFRADGGQWVVDGKPGFTSAAGVKATQTYMELLKSSPPGSATSSWSDVVEGFRAGHVAVIIESDVFGPWAEDVDKSHIAGKVGYMPPPAPLMSAGFAQGFAVSAKGNPTECSKVVSAALAAWLTSKDDEIGRVRAGILSDFARESTLNSPEYRAKANPEYVQAMLQTAPRTSLLIWNDPNWPRYGDELGAALETLFTGKQTDIQQTLNDTADNVAELTSP